MAALARDLDSKPAALTIKPVVFKDPEDLSELFQEVDREIGGETTPINVDLRIAADTVSLVLTTLRTDTSLYARFKAMARAGEVDFEILKRLNRNAPLLWVAASEAQLERELSNRRVSAETRIQATTLRDALHRILTYHFGDEPTIAERLGGITRANDHSALATALHFMGTLALTHAEELASDRRYNPKMAADALSLSAAVRTERTAIEVPTIRWSQRCAVLWTHVARDYAELIAVGRFLLRARPDEAMRLYPSLTKRSGTKRRGEEDEGKEEAVEEETPANDAEPAATPEAAKTDTPSKSGETTPSSGDTKTGDTTKPRAAKTKKAMR
jgi:hypothetical protein